MSVNRELDPENDLPPPSSVQAHAEKPPIIVSDNEDPSRPPKEIPVSSSDGFYGHNTRQFLSFLWLNRDSDDSEAAAGLAALPMDEEEERAASQLHDTAARRLIYDSGEEWEPADITFSDDPPDMFWHPGMVASRPLPPPPERREHDLWTPVRSREHGFGIPDGAVPKPWAQQDIFSNTRNLSTKTNSSYFTARSAINGISNASMASRGLSNASVVSRTSFVSARANLDSTPEGGLTRELNPSFVESAKPEPGPTEKWLQDLETQGIILKPEEALDWSGHGQHVVYGRDEGSSIPLRVERTIGHSATALVESVRCRRIRLARKQIRCSRRITQYDAIREVQHLQRLSHFHLIRVVGTYIMGRDLSILLYPVSEWNLEQFMDDIVDHITVVEDFTHSYEHRTRISALQTFFGCSANAIHYIHSRNVKHMDIKPKNLLVRKTTISGPDRIKMFKVYIADFGIARSYNSPEEAETDSRTSFTRTYAAPEVVLQETRGFSADMFSLGCVFAELIATLLSTANRNMRSELEEVRQSNEEGDSSFSANIALVRNWLSRIDKNAFVIEPLYMRMLRMNATLLEIIPHLLDEVAALRPSAEDLAAMTEDLRCLQCNSGPEPFEAAKLDQIGKES